MSFENVKSVVVDIADNWGYATYLGLRSLEFKNNGTLISLINTDMVCYSTTNEGSAYVAQNAFITALSKTGSWDNTSWVADSGSTTNQRLICVFDNVQTFDEIVANNFHTSGEYTDMGIKNTKIYTSTDALAFEDRFYGEAVSNGTLIYDDVVAEHSESDAADDQILVENTANDIEAEIPMLTLEMFPPYNITADIPFLTFEAFTGSNISVEFPSLALEIIVVSATIVAEIPSLTLESSVSSTMLIDFEATLPPLFLTASTSASATRDDFDMEIPALTMESHLGADIEMELPILSCEIEGRIGRVADLKASFPSLTMSSESGSNVILEIPFLSMDIEGSIVEATVELTADVEGSIPSLQMRIISKPLDNISASLPMLTMAMSAQQGGDNDFSLMLPALIASINSGTITDDALRYIRGKIR